MKKVILLLLVSAWCGTALWGQSSEELLRQFKSTESQEEKISLALQLAKQYLRERNEVESERFAKAAFNLADKSGNYGMGAQSAYFLSEFYRSNGNQRKQDDWLKVVIGYAKKAEDFDLLIRGTQKRSSLATRDRNYRRAYEINQEAFKYFSDRGQSISELVDRYNQLRFKLQNEQAALEAEKEQLQEEISSLSTERDQLSVEKNRLQTRQEQLVRKNESIEEQAKQTQQQLATVSEEKQQVEAIAKQREVEVKKLSRDTLEKRLALAEAQNEVASQRMALQRRNALIRMSAVVTVSLLLLALLLYGRFRAKKRSARILGEKNNIIEEERERSENLLLNILPQPIAEELKANGRAAARRYDEASVLFSDFINFTHISERLTPEELVAELDTCFKAFDSILAKYPDVEKIKTIGDAYMCASGLSDRKSIPFNIIRVAIEMQEYLEQHRRDQILAGKPFFEARIGIHTGPVVAGVVGHQKFAYDIWGDTVNIAARMEANGQAGRVNISESTYGLIKYKFNCAYRGKVQAKNKGAIDMYFVEKELNAVPA